MRRCHSETMQDYRRVHNKEMWERPLAEEVVYRDPPAYRPKRCPVAREAVRKQGVGE